MLILTSAHTFEGPQNAFCLALAHSSSLLALHVLLVYLLPPLRLSEIIKHFYSLHCHARCHPRL